MTMHARRSVLAATLGVALLPSALAAQQPARWPSSSPPRPLAARDVKFPAYELQTLPNGLQVVVVGHAEQPAVSLRMLVRAGSAQDPAGRPGVAAMAANLLDQGTTTRTAQQVADEIDSIGGELHTGAGRDLSFVHVVVMKDSLAIGMNLLADVVRRPAFAPEELERQRQQTVSALRVSYQDPDYVANVVFDRLVYGFHPYAFPGSGTPASLERLTRDDLVQFHARYYAPNNAILAVVGDTTAADAMAVVDRAFGSWARSDVPPDAGAAPPDPTRRVIVLDKPDAVQTEIRMGQLGIPRKNTDYMAVDLAMKILGGEGANRLHRILRTERGLTYGASAEAETLKHAGEFMAQTNTRSEATGEVLRLMMEEFWRLRRENVSEEELADAEAYLTGHFPLTIETPDDIATQILNVLFYELPVDELQTYRQRVNAVGVDDIEHVATKYLKPDRLSVVLVGNAAAFLGQLKGVGFNRVEVVRLSELDLTAADFKKKDVATTTANLVTPPDRAGAWPSGLPRPVLTAGAMPAGPAWTASAPGTARAQDKAAPAAQDPAASLIERAIEAKGGLAKLRAVKTLKATTDTTFNTPQGPVTSETTTYIEYPDHFRVEATLPVGRIVQVYAGEDNVWAQDPTRGVVVPPAAARRDFRDSVRRDVLSVLLRVQAGQLKVRMAERPPGGVEEPAGGPRAVDVSGEGSDPITLYIDPTTGMVVKESYVLPAAGGTAEELFSDYRDVDGVKIAFKASLRRGSLPVAERVVREARINVPVDPSLFVKPEKH